MREARSREIDGITFTVQQLPAMRSVLLMHKLARVVGPALLKALSGGGSLLEQDLGGLSEAAVSAFDRFPAADLQQLIKDLFETGTMSLGDNTVPIMPVFDDALAGKPMTIIKALHFALEVNYGSFLDALFAAIRALQAPKVTGSLSKA